MPARPTLRVPGESPRRWPVPTIVFLVTLTVTVAMAGWATVHEDRNDRAALDAEGRAVVTALQAAVDEAGERSHAVVGLFGASNDVEPDEFARFVGHIGLSPGMFGLGYIARITDDVRSGFEARLSSDHPGAFLFELDGLDRIPRRVVEVYYPITYFESADALPAWGFDAGSDPAFFETLQQAMDSGEHSASGFTWFPGRGGSDGFVMFHPVIAADGTAIGAVAAALDLSDLLTRIEFRPGPSPVVVDAASAAELDSPDWTGTVTVADRTWLVGLDRSGSPPWLLGAAIFAAGLLSASALALATAAGRDRLGHRRELERLTLLDRQKNEFLAAVSHELRTPLTSVLGFAEELAAHPSLEAEDRAAMAQTISNEARSMEAIVQDLLVAARLQEGQTIGVVVERIPDPAESVRSLATVEARVFDSDPGASAVLADQGRFHQIVRNLLDNAVRHGSPPVEVEVRRRGGLVQIVVRDVGPGVAAEIRDLVFDKYYTSVRPDGRAPTTGIGLWVSRELARLLGGDLVLTDSSGGAEFVLSLPAADPAQAVGF